MIGNTQTDWVAHVLFEAAKTQCFHIISCDSASSFRLGDFATAYPDRLHEVGAAEQAALTVAFGLASETRCVVVVGFSSFLLFRGFEVLRSLIAYHRANVLVVGGMAGLSHGRDGFMHQTVEDLGLIRLLPEFHILTPSDQDTVAACIRLGLQGLAPAYIRITRRPVQFAASPSGPWSGSQSYRVVARFGTDAAVFTYGMLAPIALEAAEELQLIGVGVSVIELVRQRPFPGDVAAELARVRLAVTFEDHRLSGGLALDLCSIAAGTGCELVSMCVADDAVLRSGTTESLLAYHNLTKDQLVGTIASRLRV